MGRKRKRVNDDVISVTSVTSSGVGCEQVGATSDGKTTLMTSNSPCQDTSSADEPAPRNAANERERARMRVYIIVVLCCVSLISDDILVNENQKKVENYTQNGREIRTKIILANRIKTIHQIIFRRKFNR